MPLSHDRGPLQARARELRTQGLDYEEIAGALGVAKSSVSLWVRDLPRPARLSYAECRERAAEGARRDQFATPTLKRHNPRTVRKNVGETYHGCLRIDVRHSADLYRKIEGWAAASMADDRRASQVPANEHSIQGNG